MSPRRATDAVEGDVDGKGERGKCVSEKSSTLAAWDVARLAFAVVPRAPASLVRFATGRAGGRERRADGQKDAPETATEKAKGPCLARLPRVDA